MTVDSSRQNANNLHYTKNIFSRPLLDQARKCVGDEHYYNMREPMLVEISYLILLMNGQQQSICTLVLNSSITYYYSFLYIHNGLKIEK